MDSHKTIGEFDPSKESWISYTERLGQFSIVTDINSAEKKRAILLSGAWPHIYRILQSLTLPGKLSEKSFVKLVKLMKDHQQPPPNPMLERYKFHNRSQKQGETITDFVTSLRRL